MMVKVRTPAFRRVAAVLRARRNDRDSDARSQRWDAAVLLQAKFKVELALRTSTAEWANS